MPSTEKNNFLFEKIVVQLEAKQLEINVYDTPLGEKFLEALKANLTKERILEKNFCFLGWPDSDRNLEYLCDELNNVVWQINAFNSCNKWQVAGLEAYPKIQRFSPIDFQYPSDLPIGNAVNGDQMATPGKRLKHEACNLLHRYFEELQGSAWKLSEYYKLADYKTKYAIRQLNNLCHEIEAWVQGDRKKAYEPEWVRPSQITTFLNAPRHNLIDEDFELFKQNRYDRELGGVYLHWSQVGKTLYEVFRDEHAPKMTEALCSEINHQKYYSGEFDIEWGKTITENDKWKKDEMDQYRQWLDDNNYDWNDPKLSLGYIKIGQVDLKKCFGTEDFLQVYNIMKDNLNIKKISVEGHKKVNCDFRYTLDSDDWKNLQINYLRDGYESRRVR